MAPEICQSPAAMLSRPAATVSLVPAARTKTTDSGAITAIMPAAGKHADTGLQRCVPEVELQELGEHEQRAEQAEHDKSHRRDRRREPPAAEEPQVEHRV